MESSCYVRSKIEDDKPTKRVIPYAQISLSFVTFCPSWKSSGAIQRNVPAASLVVVSPSSLLRILERPKSVRHGMPSLETRILP